MNRHLLIPATIAAGVHALLLLGFRSPPSPPPMAPPDEQTPIAICSLCVEEPRETQTVIAVVDNTGCSGWPPPGLTDCCMPKRYTLLSNAGSPMHLDIPSRLPGLASVGADVMPTDWGRGESFGGEIVFDGGDLDRSPRVLLRTPPQSTAVTEIDVVVDVLFVVGKDGRVRDARIIDSANHRLDDECLRAVRRWRFEPGTRLGVPVAFRVQQSFIFNPSN